MGLCYNTKFLSRIMFMNYDKWCMALVMNCVHCKCQVIFLWLTLWKKDRYNFIFVLWWNNKLLTLIMRMGWSLNISKSWLSFYSANDQGISIKSAGSECQLEKDRLWLPHYRTWTYRSNILGTLIWYNAWYNQHICFFLWNTEGLESAVVAYYVLYCQIAVTILGFKKEFEFHIIFILTIYL